VPKATIFDILSTIRSSADRFSFPDSLYGYGIPDIVEVLRNLQQKYIPENENESVAGPNPFQNELTIYFNEDPEWLRIEILNVSGTLIFKKEYRNYISRTVVINDIQELAAGLYFVRLNTSLGTHVHKVIKVRSRT
jgi:serine protease AprX